MQNVAPPRRAAAMRTLSPVELLERCKAAGTSQEQGNDSEEGGVLRLDAIVRFRRRTRQHPVSFLDFLQALRDAKNYPITSVVCYPSMSLGIRSDEWLQLVRTFGGMEQLQTLAFPPGYGGLLAIDAVALAEMLRQSKSIRTLELSENVGILGPTQELERLARAVACSSLERLVCDCLYRVNRYARQLMVSQGISHCTTLESLSFRDPLCQLSEDDMTCLVTNLPLLKHLSLYTRHWHSLGQILAKNDTVQVLEIIHHDVDPEAFCACMNALQTNRTLRRLSLKTGQGFKGGSMKESIASLLEHNETLRHVALCDTFNGIGPPLSLCFTHFDLAWLANLTAENGLVQINVDELGAYVHDDNREDLRRQRQQLEVENKLNEIGRRSLRQNLGDRTNWFAAMLKLTTGDAPAFQRSSYFLFDEDLYRTQCFFSFFRMNPTLFD